MNNQIPNGTPGPRYQYSIHACDALMRNWVRPGSSTSKSAKISSNFGTIAIIMKIKIPIAKIKTATGYVIADLIFAFNCSERSRNSAKR